MAGRMQRAQPANAAREDSHRAEEDHEEDFFRKRYHKLERFCSKTWHRLTWWAPDRDELFAYDTVKEVRILDRRAGFLYYGIQFAVLFYVIVVVFIIKQQYLDTEKTAGWMITRVMRSQLDHLGMPWDVYDRISNPTEKGAVFIPTRVLVTKDQKQGQCESPLHNCTSDRDCRAGGQTFGCAVASGHCIRHQWCPPEDVTAPTTVVHYLDIDEVELFIQTYVHYHKFNLDVTTTDEKLPINYPEKRANTYRVRDIVRFANLEPEQFVENGAVMLLSALFRCNLNEHKCELKVEANNVDTRTGFNTVYNHIYWENGERKRDTYRMYGLRLLTSATGFGKKTSFSKIMLQLSSAISLFTIAEMVADFFLISVVAERKHYTEQKIKETEDFND
jgi:hypothetical protein